MKNLHPRGAFPALALCLAACGVLLVSPAPAAAQDGVALYEHPEYRGEREILELDDPDLSDNPIGDNKVSSVRVSPGCTAILYEHDDYRGEAIRVTGDMPVLEGSRIGDDRVSSVRVDCRRFGREGRLGSRRDVVQGVVLFEHPSFDGRDEIFYEDDPDLTDNRIGDNVASSIRIPRGCQVTLYEHTGYRGEAETLDEDDHRLADNRVGDNRVSSLRIRCREGAADGFGVTLYEHPHFRGREQVVTHDLPRLAREHLGDDNLSSLRVPRGCTVVLFEHPDYRGESEVVSRDEPDLHDNRIGDNRVSSLRVECDRRRASELERFDRRSRDEERGRGRGRARGRVPTTTARLPGSLVCRDRDVAFVFSDPRGRGRGRHMGEARMVVNGATVARYRVAALSRDLWRLEPIARGRDAEETLEIDLERREVRSLGDRRRARTFCDLER